MQRSLEETSVVTRTYSKDRGPLSPYRVLDLTDEKAFLCGKILADLGADVVKMERPGGDPGRRIGPFYHGLARPENSLFWFAYNANKRSITLNLENPDGAAILRRLVETSDFLVESFAPGYLASINLDYSVLSKANPGIIMASISPFGQTGPYAGHEASDMTVFAMGVLMSQCGDPDRPPVQVTVPQAFLNAAADAAAAMMIAHYYRLTSGDGQHIDVSAMESVLWAGSEVVPEWTFLRHEARRPGRFHVRPTAPDRPIIWKCKDGYCSFLILAGQPGERNNRKIVEWMDEAGMATDYLKTKDWPNWDWRATGGEELRLIVEPIERFLETRTKAEIRLEAARRGLSLYPVNDTRETLEDPQLSERDFWVKVKHEDLNDTITCPGAFAKFTETPITRFRRAPTIGEHNAEIFEGELGFSKASLAAMKSGGVI